MSGLYLHIPYCRSKCPYCDFFSLADTSLPIADYAAMLVHHLDIAARSGKHSGPFETVFFGGGTPSLLPPEALARIMEAVRDRFGLASGAEVSLEANPGTVSPATLSGYREAGVNRLSFGVQSFSEEALRRLGRSHSREDAVAAVGSARAAGFDNVGLDLMFALPGQGETELAAELDQAMALAPEHLSCYGLSIEEQTPFYHLHRSGALELPEEESYAALFAALHERLTREGYAHYEISNYARPGRECRHNLAYWRRLAYLGVGAGAHSFLPDAWGERQAVPADMNRYRQSLLSGQDPAETLETFDKRGAMAETLYLGLRTSEGIKDERFRQAFGRGVSDAFPKGVEKAGRHLRLRQGSWSLDLEGWLLYDHLIMPFLE